MEAAAVGFAEAEAHPRHPLGAVATVRVQFAHHAIQVDALMGEGAERGIAGGHHQVPERLGALWAQPHRHGVAEVPDGIVGTDG